MNLIDYIFFLPYKIIWNILNFFSKRQETVFYCEDPLDYHMFLPIQKHLSIPIIYVARKKKSKTFFRERNIPFKSFPAFPAAVIMARHAAFRFPAKKVVKIGFDHGLYQFKRWTATKYYNRFDVYLVSSPHQEELARQRGIRTTKAVGYPKLDKAFDGTISAEDLRKLSEQLNLNPDKETILFSSTWDVDGLSALNRWIDKAQTLTDEFNVLLTVHTWTKFHLVDKLKKIKGAVFLQEQDITPHLMLCDYFVGDYNSLIGEACALDKKIITFRVPQSPRAISEVRKMIAELSYQIDEFEEIYQAIEFYRRLPQARAEERRRANEIMFLTLDGQAGQRAAEIISNMIQH